MENKKFNEEETKILNFSLDKIENFEKIKTKKIKKETIKQFDGSIIVYYFTLHNRNYVEQIKFKKQNKTIIFDGEDILYFEENFRIW